MTLPDSTDQPKTKTKLGIPFPTFVDFLSKKWYDKNTRPGDPKERVIGEIVRCPVLDCKEEIKCIMRKEVVSFATPPFTREEYQRHYAEIHQ